MPSDSTIPVALENLVAMFTESPAIGGAGVAVLRGPYPAGGAGGMIGNAAVYVGFSPLWATDPLTGKTAETGVEIKSQMADLGGQRVREQYTVHCAAQFLDGDSNMTNATTAATGYAAAARETIALNRSLNGLQGIARPGAGNTTETFTDKGAKSTVEFDIEVDAFTSYRS